MKLAESNQKNNYYKNITVLQKNKFYSNDKKLDKIINEEDEKKISIKQLKIDDTINFSSSGYAAQLFSKFNNNHLLCFKESKSMECFICEMKCY